jgi:1-acyl-sn-glycerol-3-phosphate acyltransferase
MSGNIRIVMRLLVMLGWTLPCMLIQAVCLALPGLAKVRFAQFYWRGAARILGLRIKVRGQITQHRPVLFIANHCTWLDIIVLGAVLPGCFVAKGDIANWPFIKWIARLGRTVFVSRAKASLERERDGLLGRLAAGDNIILFPEGTTSDGTRVLPFQSSFLAIASAPSKPAIQLVTLVYDELDGLPVRRRDRPDISWYGDMDMASHFPRVGRRKSIGATIVIDPEIPPGSYANRKILANVLQSRLAANAAALRQGRLVEAAPALPDKAGEYA